MATETRLPNVSAAAAACMRRDAPLDERLKAAKGEVALPPSEFALVLLFLMHDEERAVRTAAVASLRTMPEAMLTDVALSSQSHPKVLEVLARIHSNNQNILRLLSANPVADERTRNFIAGVLPPPDNMPGPDDPGPFPAGEDDVAEEDSWAASEEEEFKSKYQLAQTIGISDKIKFAMTGDKEWRSIMLKDSNKLVSGAVLKNPRITDQEILSVAKSNMVNEETVRIICNNKDWVKNYQIRKALVENHKTPLPIALRFLATLSEKDLIMLSKSKNVSTVIATQARKAVMLLQKRR